MMIRLYLALGVIAALAVSHGFAYYKGYSNSSQSHRIAVLEHDLKEAQDAYKSEQAARRLDAQQAIKDRKDADLGAAKTQELEDALTDRDRQCFDAGDADGLRQLFAD